MRCALPIFLNPALPSAPADALVLPMTESPAPAIALAEKLRGAGLQERIFAQIAQGYAGQAQVLHFEEGLEPGQVRLLAEKISEICPSCGVFSPGGDGWLYCLAAREKDLRPLGRALCQQLHGRGGGKPSFQQGSLQASREEIERFFSGICW